MHIPDDPAYYEKFYFTPGDLGFHIFPTEFGNLGVLVCWDQWFPEAARLVALRGADVIFYPTAIGWHPAEKAEHGAVQRDAWRTVQRGHAIANGVYVAAINRVGVETLAGPPGLEFWGTSFLCDPQGVVLAGRRPSARRSWSALWIQPTSKTCAGTGPFCVTGVSMPMPGWTVDFLIKSSDEQKDTL
jgi:N-carbamoylputrescine amidase